MKRKAIVLIAANLLAQLADGLLTWIATPDLSLEGNPLVVHLGLGWGALFLANAMAFLLLSWLIWYAYVKYRPKIVQAARPTEYVSMLLFGRPDRFRWIFYKLRFNWRPALAAGGFAFAYSFLAARLILVGQWIAHLTGVRIGWYSALRSVMPGGRLDIVVALVLVLVLFFLWFARQYRLNQAAAGVAV